MYVVVLRREFIFLQRKPKGVTTQMKALDEYNLMVLSVLLLKRVHLLAFLLSLSLSLLLKLDRETYQEGVKHI